MSTPKPEAVAALIDAHGYYPTSHGSACSVLRVLAGVLLADIEQDEKMKRRGAAGRRKAYELIAPMIHAYADALAGYKPVSTDPIDCPAVLAGTDIRCIRTEPGHEAHRFPHPDPVPLAQLIESGAVVETGLSDPIIETTQGICGMTYINSTDVCLLDPDHVLSREPHQARNSRWPVSDADVAIHNGDAEEVARLAIYEPLKAAHAGDAAKIVAFIKGETDDLGTEPLSTEGTGISNPQVVSLSGSVTNPEAFALLKEATVQPTEVDPFGSPVARASSTVWMGGAQPVKPDPRSLWLPPFFDDAPPASIRVTAVRTGEQCGMAYRLISRDEVPEIPSWANVGGTTLHECARHLEEMYLSGNYDAALLADLDDVTVRAWWDHHWTKAVADTECESPGFTKAQWRAADKGAEGAEWWAEMGPDMVRDYAAASAQWHAEGWSILPVAQGPAMELEMRTPLPTGGELVGHLDQAWFRLDEGDVWQIRIRDLKTSSKMPEDEWQMDAYTYLLYQRLRESGMDLSRCSFSVVHYDARNGKDAEVRTIDIEGGMLGVQTVYRASSVLRMHESNNYPANPGNDWKAPCYVCAVRYACPIMAMKS